MRKYSKMDLNTVAVIGTHWANYIDAWCVITAACCYGWSSGWSVFNS